MSVEIYKGTYITAESASNYIDVIAITTGCDKINEAGTLFENIGNRLTTISTELNNETLSVGGKTMQGPLEDVASFIKNVKPDLETVSSEINSALEKALDKKQLELNEIAKAQDAAKIAENQNNNQ